MTRKALNQQAVRMLPTRIERLKRLRNWIEGYQAGSGKSVPYADEIRLLVLDLEPLMPELKKMVEKQ